jgi:hypothetical protein
LVLALLSVEINQLALLQSPGACVLQGPEKLAREALQALLYEQMDPALQQLTSGYAAWKGDVAQLKEQMGSDEANSGSIAWGDQLQQMLRETMGVQGAAALRDFGAAVCSEFPVKLCCNNRGARPWPRWGRCCWAAAAAAARLRGTAARPARVQRGRWGTARCASASPRQRQQQGGQSRAVLCLSQCSAIVASAVAVVTSMVTAGLVHWG